jgi:hypothetical protein
LTSDFGNANLDYAPGFVRRAGDRERDNVDVISFPLMPRGRSDCAKNELTQMARRPDQRSWARWHARNFATSTTALYFPGIV